MINNSVKLVIWDMDDTFWNGTISEGSISIPPEHIEIVRCLCNRGIMNSICSKNDYGIVEEELKKAGIFDYFIFPHINWMPKGEQISEIISECQLRADNVLYIDDNPHNLQEALHVCPKLQIETPEIIEKLLSISFLQGKIDSELTRLSQYKALEKKTLEKKKYSNNYEFLYESDIRVSIHRDCEKQIDRISELINRTNQLNFTKVRIDRKEVETLLHDSDRTNCYITAQDKFGEYGIVGFASVKNGEANHFLFSCRTIGMGIEQWVYAELGYPKIIKNGETISDVNFYDKPGWINRECVANHVNKCEKNKKKKKRKVLIRGGCDLSQMEPYLSNLNLSCEFNHLNYHRDHSVFAIDILDDDFAAYRNEIIKNVPFVDESNFATRMYDEKFDYIVISVLMDYCQGVYALKSNPAIKIAYANFNNKIDVENHLTYTADELEWFLDNFEFVGRTTPEEFRKYLHLLREKICADTKLIFINGCEISHENESEKDFVCVHREMNHVLDNFVSESHKVYLLDVRKIVTERAQLTNNIRHYTRDVYYKIAEELVNIINSNENEAVAEICSEKKWMLYKKIVRRLKVFIHR